MKNYFSLTNRRVLCAVFAIIALLSSTQVFAVEPWDGTTLTEPQTNDNGTYVVTNGAELAWIANESNQGEAYTHSFVLANDIDLGNHPWKPIGLNANTTTKNYFAGNIDGQGHTIKGLHIVASATDTTIGFIGGCGGTVSAKSSFKNINLEGEVIVTECSNADIGTLAGFINDLVSVENCHSKVNITYSASTAKGNYLGGLVGRLKGTAIKNCSYGGTITLSVDAEMTNGWGGLIGSFNSSTADLVASVEGCTFEGVIDSKATATIKYGAALVGYANLSKGTTTIKNNIVKGSMTVATRPTNYGIWYGKAGGTVNATENYTDHFMMDGVESTTLPETNPTDPNDPVTPPADGKIRILCIGNSFTVDAVEDYLAPICASVGKDVIIGYPYKGGTTLEQHMDYINSANAIYAYRKIVNGVHQSQGSTIFDVALKDEVWDKVIIQTDHNYSGLYDHYFPYLTNLMNYVKANGKNHNPEMYLYMTWAYDATSSYNAFSLYGNDQMTMYNAIVDCAFRAAEEAGIANVIPGGTAVQNCRTTYIGQNMNRDGYHMNYEYGRYVVGLTYAAVVLGIDPQTVTFHPATISDNLAQLCRDAVTAALAQPKQPTSLAEKWGVNPDVVNAPLSRAINLSLEASKSEELMGTNWNVIDPKNIASAIDNLIDVEFIPTPVRVSMNKAFTNEEPGSLLFTGLYHGQSYDITLSYMLNGEPARIVQNGINPDVNGRVYVDAETASAHGDGIDGLYAIHIEPRLTYIDGESGLEKTLDPAEGVPTRMAPGTPWDGTTVSEPALGAGQCYVINCGAELAYVAKLSNEATTSYSMLINEDIDLGGHKWTPIGKTNYYNGNILGQNHTIKGLYLEPAAADINCGLIGQTNSTSKIKDLTIEGVMNIKQLPTGSNADFGSFIGLANALKTLENCHAQMTINGEKGFGIYQGGLIGRMKMVKVDRCSFDGNVTIGTTNSKTKGWGGLVGTANSGVDGKGSITNCAMNADITSTTATATTYGSAVIGYANLSAGVLDISNNYVGGTITISGTKPTNYGVMVGKATGEGSHTVLKNNYVVNQGTLKADHGAIDMSVEQMNNGELCYLLNGDQSVIIFGQELDTENRPVINGEQVFKTDYIVDDANYATNYNNQTLRFPAAPEKKDMTFGGWFDKAENGTEYTVSTVVDSDLTLYAHFLNSTSLSTPSTLHSTLYTLHSTLGQAVSNDYRGIVIENGRKYLRK